MTSERRIPAAAGNAVCPAAVLTDDGAVVCSLPGGHAGLHYDDTDDISWTKGRPHSSYGDPRLDTSDDF